MTKRMHQLPAALHGKCLNTFYGRHFSPAHARRRFLPLTLALALLLWPSLGRAQDPNLNGQFPVNRETLSPPIVSDPIHECAKAVHVSGFIPHAMVRVLEDGLEVGHATPFFGDDDIALTHALTLGRHITATQTVGSVTSPPSYDPVTVTGYPDPLKKPVVDSHIYACGRIVPASNLNVSTQVDVFKSTTNLIGQGNATGEWLPVLTSPLAADDPITAKQIACPDTPAKKKESAMSDTVHVLAAPAPTPKPVVEASSVVVGNDVIVVDSLFTGAGVSVSQTGAVTGSGLATASRNRVPLGRKLNGDPVTARQSLCTPSDPSLPVTPATSLPAPVIVAPVCRGTHYVAVRNTVVNAVVVIFRNGAVAGMAGAGLGDVKIALAAGVTWNEGDSIAALQYIGPLTSPISATVFAGCAGENVLTQHNDNSRSGGYLAETQLRPANVNATSFGRLYARSVDGNIFGQPLYIRKVNVPGVGMRNLVIVTTALNKIYAFDADNTNGAASTAPVWIRDLNREHCQSLSEAICFETKPPFVGITSTAVIDADTHIMYFVARCSNDNGNYFVYAADVATGGDRMPRRLVTGAAQDNPSVTFDPHCHRNRPGLLLINGVVYVGFATFSCDAGCGASPYHGWVFGYRADNLNPAGVFNTSSSGGGAGIWQSGNGLVGDSAGNIYFETGNDTVVSALGDSFAKLSTSGGLALAGSFTPNNASQLRNGDTDLGSGGPMLLPGDRLIGGGKQGRYYILNTKNMKITQDCDAASGHCSPGVSHSSSGDGFQAFILSYHNDPSQPACNDVPPAEGCHRMDDSKPNCFIPTSKYQNGEYCGPNIHAGPVYWKGAAAFGLIYQMAEEDNLKAFSYDLTSHKVSETPAVTATGSLARAPRGMPGGSSSISAHKDRDGILWLSVAASNAQGNNVPGHLAAFDAVTLRQIWQDNENYLFAKFVPPTVADGKVFRATFTADIAVPAQLVVYGLTSNGTHAGSHTMPAQNPSEPSPIEQKYLNLGGFPGKATSDEMPVGDNAGGRVRHYSDTVTAVPGFASLKLPSGVRLPPAATTHHRRRPFSNRPFTGVFEPARMWSEEKSVSITSSRAARKDASDTRSPTSFRVRTVARESAISKKATSSGLSRKALRSACNSSVSYTTSPRPPGFSGTLYRLSPP